jgi:hypothetical protein
MGHEATYALWQTPHKSCWCEKRRKRIKGETRLRVKIISKLHITSCISQRAQIRKQINSNSMINDELHFVLSGKEGAIIIPNMANKK